MRRIIIVGIFLGLITFTYPLSSLSCTSPKPPKLSLNPTQIDLQFQNGVESGNKIADRVYLSNLGDGEIIWVTSHECPWLIVEPSSGTCRSENMSITLSTSPDTLSKMNDGHYAAICKFYAIDDATNSQIVAVNLNIVPTAIKTTAIKTYDDPLKRFSFKYPADFTFNSFEKIQDRSGNYFEIGKVTATVKDVIDVDRKIFLTCKIYENDNNISKSGAKYYIYGWLESLSTLSENITDVTLVERVDNVDGWDCRGSYYYFFDLKDPIYTGGFYEISTAYVKVMPRYVLYIEVSTLRRSAHVQRPDESWLRRIYYEFMPFKPVIDSFVFY